VTITTIAIVNALLVGTLLAALAYVCLVPFRLDRLAAPAVAMPAAEAAEETRDEKLAA
jgi:hypothetical protein